MRWRILLLSLFVTTPTLAQSANEIDWASDESLLREQKLPTKGAGLAQILRDRTPSPEVIRQFKQPQFARACGGNRARFIAE